MLGVSESWKGQEQILPSSLWRKHDFGQLLMSKSVGQMIVVAPATLKTHIVTALGS